MFSPFCFSIRKSGEIQFIYKIGTLLERSGSFFGTVAFYNGDNEQGKLLKNGLEEFDDVF